MSDVGFLARYRQTATIDCGDGYLIRFTPHLSRAAHEAAQTRLMSPLMRIQTTGEEGDSGSNETTATLDTGAQQDEYVAWALAEWNLTDEDNVPIPLGTCDREKGPDAERRRAVKLLPGEVFDRLIAGIEGIRVSKKAKEAETAADAAFPESGTSGAPASRRVRAVGAG